MTLLIDAVTADPKDRRMMLVASDDKLKSIVSRVLGQSYLNLVVGWPLRAVLQPGMGFLADRLLQEDPPHGPLTQLAVSCVRRELPYPRISLRQANHPPFKFDVGHVPEDGALYVQHPCFQDRYVPPALVNDLLAREKLGAFRQIAASLGAKEIRIISGAVRSRDWRGKATIPLPDAASQIGLGARFDSQNSVIEEIYARYDKPRTPPKVPSELEPWVEMDPSLRAMKHGRLQARLSEDAVSLEIREEIGGMGRAAVGLEKYGINVGGRYKSVIHSLWHYRVVYWPTP